MPKNNNRLKKQPNREELRSELQYQPGNADTIQIKLLEMINKNLNTLIQEVKNGRQGK